MKYYIDPVLVSRAIAGMSKVGDPSHGSARVRLDFLDSGVVFSRADREQLVEFLVPARGAPEGDLAPICLDWAKFSGVMKNGLVASDVEVSYDPTTTFVVFKQGSAIRVKLPVATLDSRIPFTQPADALQYAVNKEGIPQFFKAMNLVSTFCVDKIVGRGKFSGVVVHGDRVVASSHEGAFIANASLGIQGHFGIPAGVVWTLLNLKASTDLNVTFGPGLVGQGQVKSACLSGVLEGMKWAVEFPFHQPFHTFLGYDLTKPLPPWELSFDTLVLAGHLHAGFQAASAVQSKADVWVELTDLTEIGFSIKGRDVARTVESAVNVPLEEFTGDLNQSIINVKKSSFIDLLSQLDGKVAFGYDQKGGKMVLSHEAGTGFMSCNVGED